MIEVLIIDDNYDKVKNITGVFHNNPEVNVKHFVDVKNALIDMQHFSYDLLILDINLPMSIGESPSKEGGLHILNKIHTKQIHNYPHHIIAITEYEDIFTDSQQYLEQYLWTLIHYNNTTNTWQDKIKNKIDYLIQSKKCSLPQYCYKNFDIAIVTALSTELEPVLQLKYNWKKLTLITDPTVIYYEGEVKIDEKIITIVAAHAPKMGMVPSAILTTKMCFHFKPKYFFMVGIAAGIKEKVNIGDILVSEVCWDWGSGKIASDFSPDHTQITIDASILTKLETIKTNQTLLDNIKNLYLGHKPSETLKMHIGPIASGASVLQNKERVNDIKKHQRKLIGIEMEIYGVMSALKYSITPSPKGICLKSVSDYGEESKSEYEAYQPYAAYTSAQVMQLLITELFKD